MREALKRIMGICRLIWIKRAGFCPVQNRGVKMSPALPGALLIRAYGAGALFACTMVLSGCTSIQEFPTSHARSISLDAGQLEAQGIAFITPSTATGREEEKQAVAFVFAEVLKRERPGVKVVSLPESLSAVNRANLGDSYKRMYDDYRDTGLFKRETLGEVGRITGCRFIAQIKLQEFSEGAKERWGAMGFRIVETRYARVRLFFQIWDSQDGSIAWEGMEEIVYSHERLSEEPVTFQRAADRAAQHLTRRLP